LIVQSKSMQLASTVVKAPPRIATPI
jgi:hypothetical protein